MILCIELQSLLMSHLAESAVQGDNVLCGRVAECQVVARSVANVGRPRQVEKIGILAGDFEFAEVPEDTGGTILELNIFIGVDIGPVRKAAGSFPVVASFGAVK